MVLLLQVSERVLNRMWTASLPMLWVHNVQEAANVSNWHTTIPTYSLI